jgi:hypothetical protein
MSALSIQPTYPIFTETDGLPLENGYIWIGTANLDPQGNPINVYWDSALTIAAPQPIRTLGGYPSRNGTPARMYVNSDYSIRVQNKNGSLVYSAAYGAQSISADLVSFTGFKNQSGTVSDLADADGADWIGFEPAGAGAVAVSVQDKLRQSVSIADFGAVGDGTTDDTAAIQAAIDSGAKHIIVPYGEAGIYKLTNAVFFNTAGVTMEWENNSIVFKKFYGTIGSVGPGLANLIVVNAAYITLVNPGIDGNGANYGGSGIAYNRSDTYFTFGCRIVNPNIKNTRDSGVVFFGPRGAPDIVIDGGTIITWQDPAFAGASSSGFPSIRVVGAVDGNPSPRVFNNITASSAILLDATGMNSWKMSNCFTGTILYQGNPDATGGTDPYRTGESAVVNTYIRDGIVVAGFENSVENSLSHGNAPLTWTAYGGTPATYSTYGWEISNNSVLCKLGTNNVVTDGIIDNSPQGVATGLLSSLYNVGTAFATQWEGSVADPSIGNGSIYCEYDSIGQFINFRFTLTFGSTTTRGTGDWSFSLPRWCNTSTPSVGNWTGYLFGIGRFSGTVVLSSTGGTHKISLLAADGATVIGSASPASIPAGSVITVQFFYLRG